MLGWKKSNEPSRPEGEKSPPGARAASTLDDLADEPVVAPAALGINDDLRGGGDEIWSPPKAEQRKTITELLLERRHINEEQLTQARTIQSQTPGKNISQILLGMNAASEAQVLSALADTLGLQFVVPDRASVEEGAFGLLPVDYIRQKQVLPLRNENGSVVVGMVDPTNVFLLDELRRRLRKPVSVVVITSTDVSRIIELMTQGSSDVQVDDIIKDVAEDDVQLVQTAAEDAADLEKMGSESPIIRFVNYLMQDALRQGASDIHVEPKDKALKIRYRIDGVLFEMMNPPYHMHAAIVSRMKIMANLDIAERRVPQDGRIRMIIQDRKIDLRMSTLPTNHGEKVVLRILDNRSISVPLEALGFSKDHLETWLKQIDEPHGILLVTGPTGSGKTTTLYSSLRVMDANKLNISTVEDPIEYALATANQTQVHEKIGMTFSAALRALLRQDPDVIMLGEIRDQETAQIAVQAALTGHLVLSTLHTNDAPSSITRLINIGVEPYLIASAVNAILAQRLVRKICQQCKEEFTPPDEMRKYLEKQGLPVATSWRGKGCDRCRRTGYSGRLGIYELLVMDDGLRDLVTTNPDVTAFRRQCRDRGLVTLRQDGFMKVTQGLTTAEEVIRVTESV
jgi:type IV pilus assembly protein PilB